MRPEFKICSPNSVKAMLGPKKIKMTEYTNGNRNTDAASDPGYEFLSSEAATISFIGIQSVFLQRYSTVM
jgi:hypothetical protein